VVGAIVNPVGLKIACRPERRYKRRETSVNAWGFQRIERYMVQMRVIALFSSIYFGEPAESRVR